jgi:DNA-binding transcriptional MerR regulator
MLKKDDGAFLTIGEVSDRFGVAAHILRYWESKFSGLRPMQRAGNRRYYRPEDVAMVAEINSLLNEQGYTVSGAAKLLSARAKSGAASRTAMDVQTALGGAAQNAAPSLGNHTILAIRAVRDRLAAALEAA